MRIIYYLLENLITFLLSISETYGLISLKMLVYKFVLYMSILCDIFRGMGFWILWKLGPDPEPLLYLFFLIFLVYLLFWFIHFLRDPNAYLPWSRTHRRWGLWRILRFLQLIFLFLLMFTFVDCYFTFPQFVFLFHLTLGDTLMFFLEALIGVNFFFSIWAILTACYASGSPLIFHPRRRK